MSAFQKVLDAIKSKKENGHAVNNQKNKLSLAVAKREIEMALCITK